MAWKISVKYQTAHYKVKFYNHSLFKMLYYLIYSGQL